MTTATDSEILEWIDLAMGGPGSGAQAGHPFEGNQWGQQEAKDAKNSADRAGIIHDYLRYAPERDGHRDAAGYRLAASEHMDLAGEHMQAADDQPVGSTIGALNYTASAAHSYAANAASKAADAIENGDPAIAGILNNSLNSTSNAEAASQNVARIPVHA